MKTQIRVDLETLGRDERAFIIQIGAVEFDEYGNVYGVSSGTVTVTAQNKTGSVIDTISVQVIEPITSVQLKNEFKVEINDPTLQIKLAKLIVIADIRSVSTGAE